MMLGAINPINVNVIKDRITTTQSDPSKIQTFATKTEQIVDYSKEVSPVNQPTDYMAMIKKYAPYAIGAILLYYVISKK
jgi:ureidoglycolate hydrolase